MNNSINTYLNQLKIEMCGLDTAIIRDALADAEEHLRTALACQLEGNADLDEDEALQKIIEQYGSPAETASAYSEAERRTFTGLARSSNQASNSFLGQIFGVYVDPKTWGAMLYMLISLVTGVVYFTWAVTGLSLSISLSIFIFGLPLALLFLISVRGIALLEGRLVEALLGMRMPRRPIFTSQESKWLQRLKTLLKDGHTWLSLLYLILQLILGVLYFTIIVTLLSLSLGICAIPVLQLIFPMEIIYFGSIGYTIPYTLWPLIVLVGILLLTLTLHLARGIGRLHGKYAKFILVGD